MEFVYPKPVKPGDSVCFCTPSLPVLPNKKERIDRRQACADWAEALGLRPVFTRNFAKHTEIQSAQSLKMRLEDFNEALDYPFISIVGGGGGAVSLLDGIDYDMARRNRPVIMGMSDQTNLVNAITARAGLVTYYGPNGGFGHWYQADGNPRREQFVRRTIDEIRSAVWQRKAHLAPTGLEEDAEWKPCNLRVESFGCGEALEGITYGGHWGSAAQTNPGTPFFLPPQEKNLIFLEALHDLILPNFIAFERMRAMGYFRNASVICGGPIWEKDPIRKWVVEYFQQRQIPLVIQLAYGHIHPIAVLPVGADAKLDMRTLELTW